MKEVVETMESGHSCKFLGESIFLKPIAYISQSFTDIKLNIFSTDFHRPLNPEAKCHLISLQHQWALGQVRLVKTSSVAMSYT